LEPSDSYLDIVAVRHIFNRREDDKDETVAVQLEVLDHDRLPRSWQKQWDRRGTDDKDKDKRNSLP